MRSTSDVVGDILRCAGGGPGGIRGRGRRRTCSTVVGVGAAGEGVEVREVVRGGAEAAEEGSQAGEDLGKLWDSALGGVPPAFAAAAKALAASFALAFAVTLRGVFAVGDAFGVAGTGPAAVTTHRLPQLSHILMLTPAAL
jgi:hypothetical protein